jgi:hypothetical protein
MPSNLIAPFSLMRGLVGKLLPQASQDSSSIDAGVRVDRYGGVMVSPITPPSDYADADEGSVIILRTPTVGTGAIFTAAQTTFADVNPQLYLYNGEDPKNPAAKTLSVRLLKFVTTAAATSVATKLDYAFQLDPQPRKCTTNDFDWYSSGPKVQQSTVQPPQAYNANLQTAIPQLVFGYQAASATASVFSASSIQSVVAARGNFGGLNQAGDILSIVFGQYDSGSSGALTAAEGAGQPGSRIFNEPPLIVPPGCTLTGYFWAAAMSASYAPEITLVLRAR